MPRNPFENLHNKIDSWMATPEKNISTHLEHDKKKGSYVNYTLSCVLALLIYLIRWLLIDPAFRNFWLAKWLYYLPDRVYIAFCALNLHMQVLSITAIIIILAIAWTLNHNLQTEKDSIDQANAYAEKKAQDERDQQLRLEKERKQAQIDTQVTRSSKVSRPDCSGLPKKWPTESAPPLERLWGRDRRVGGSHSHVKKPISKPTNPLPQ